MITKKRESRLNLNGPEKPDVMASLVQLVLLTLITLTRHHRKKYPRPSNTMLSDALEPTNRGLTPLWPPRHGKAEPHLPPAPLTKSTDTDITICSNPR